MRELNNLARVLRDTKNGHDKNTARFNKAISGINPDLKNSVAYDKAVQAATNEYEKKRIEIAEEGRKKAIPIIESARKNFDERRSEPSSMQEINVLTVLSHMKPGTLSPADFQSCGARIQTMMGRRWLAQIGEDHHVQVNLPDSDIISFSIDRLEDIAATFIGGYCGDESKQSATVNQIAQYLMGDEDFQNTTVESTMNANRALWNNLVGAGSPEWLDSPKESPFNVEYKYHFRDVKGLKEYINNRCEGLSERDAEDERAKILMACPSQYDTALRYYETTGEMLELEG